MRKHSDPPLSHSARQTRKPRLQSRGLFIERPVAFLETPTRARRVRVESARGPAAVVKWRHGGCVHRLPHVHAALQVRVPRWRLADRTLWPALACRLEPMRPQQTGRTKAPPPKGRCARAIRAPRLAYIRIVFSRFPILPEKALAPPVESLTSTPFLWRALTATHTPLGVLTPHCGFVRSVR